MDNLTQYRKEMFEYWIRKTIDCWLHEYGAWDDLIGDDDFEEEDWEWIRDNLFVAEIKIEEIK